MKHTVMLYFPLATQLLWFLWLLIDLTDKSELTSSETRIFLGNWRWVGNRRQLLTAHSLLLMLLALRMSLCIDNFNAEIYMIYFLSKRAFHFALVWPLRCSNVTWDALFSWAWQTIYQKWKLDVSTGYSAIIYRKVAFKWWKSNHSSERFHGNASPKLVDQAELTCLM